MLVPAKRARASDACDTRQSVYITQFSILETEPDLRESILGFVGPFEWHRIQRVCRCLHRHLDLAALKRISTAGCTSETPTKSLHDAALSGDVESVAIQIARQGGPLTIERYGQQNDVDHGTPLHAAAIGGHTSMVRLLTKNLGDTSIDAHNQHQETAAALSSFCGHAAVLTCLLEARGSVEEPARMHGCTALCIAAHYGDTNVVKCLLKGRADVNARSASVGYTPLMTHAWSPGDIPLLDLLLRGRADVNASDRRGFTPLDFAKNDGGRQTETLLGRRTTYCARLLEAGAVRGTCRRYSEYGLPPPIAASIVLRRMQLAPFSAACNPS